MINIAKQVYSNWLNPNVSKDVLDATKNAINEFKSILQSSIPNYSFEFIASSSNNIFSIKIKDKNYESVCDISSNINISVDDDTTNVAGKVIDQDFNQDFDNLNLNNYKQELKEAFQAITDFITDEVNTIENLPEENLEQELI